MILQSINTAKLNSQIYKGKIITKFKFETSWQLRDQFYPIGFPKLSNVLNILNHAGE